MTIRKAIGHFLDHYEDRIEAHVQPTPAALRYEALSPSMCRCVDGTYEQGNV
jgi:hypothetical protein